MPTKITLLVLVFLGVLVGTWGVLGLALASIGILLVNITPTRGSEAE